MSKPYKICPNCGVHLDPGEICDCKDKETRDTATAAGMEAGQQATGNPRGPVLVPGA